jgi:hypothetical protein
VYVFTNEQSYSKSHQTISRKIAQAVIDRKSGPSFHLITETVSNNLNLLEYYVNSATHSKSWISSYKTQVRVPTSLLHIPSCLTSPTSLPATLTTSNKLRIRRRRRHQTLLISTVKMNTLTTTPLSNTSSNQSDRIFK